ncbi:PTS transporter subunit EIIC [Allostreptomyces psammosilenae]|uniref:PTS system N-acetylglucosamine-specific IIC component n=1 Tax=Allostreptomyces psammosilenae TaxID=1892865 RepID=A0A853A5N9_9ACTN|nr:PTS transporter subunit EIIC [Allostreptomyces psammosilenae]NYI08164.1 PTS system N-acetylglucosamine-specific IIC component [Allostreptomyces psammosilenae]
MSTASAASEAPSKGRNWRSSLFQNLQKIGRSLQLPIAVLPAAGLLNRLGQPDVFGAEGLGWDRVSQVIGAAGGAVFANLSLLFCIGVAIGFAKKADGSTALAAVVGYLVFNNVLTAFPDDEGNPQNPGVLGGIVVGLITAVVWQRYHRTKLVDWLGFFNGRRLVPMQMALIGLVLGILFGLLWGPIGTGLENFGDWLIGLGALGSGIFGFINRLLIPIGMHQFVNTFLWFQVGDFTNAAGEVVHGDIARFYAGDPEAGIFMTGFYPIMMFGLPAAALAITHCARPERRKEVGGLMLSVALTAFVTGVTEPLEFSFMFVAPLLYGLHAVLTGISMAVTWALGIKDGFTFSGGLIDYGLAWSNATQPWMIIPVGLVFAVVYYLVFRFAITRFNLPTPGREPEEDLVDTTKP